MKNAKISCTNIDCLERKGGQCNASSKITEEELEFVKKFEKYIKENSVNLDSETRKFIDDNFMDLLYK